MSSPSAPIDSFVPSRPLRRDGDDPLAFLQHLAATDDDVVPFAIGRRQAFLLNAPARIEDVLIRQTQCFEKGRGYVKASRLLGGSGLLTVEDAQHRERRQSTQAAFHRGRVESAVPTIVSRAAACGSRWNQQVPIDIAKEMRELTLEIAGEVLFETDVKPWADVVAGAITRALAPMDGLLAIVAPPAAARRARRELDVVIDAILAARSAARPAPHDLLATLIEATAGIPDGMQRLRDDVVTFLVAGHDTISLALTWTWLLLSDHPEADARLASEIDTVLGARLPESADVARLTYTRAVLREALRLFPPAWVIVRTAIVPVRLGGVDLPAGSLVVASPYVMHRDARYFPRPAAFDPARWLSLEDEAARPKCAYLPFGAGPRACIGEGFAWMEGTLVLATLAQHWRLSKTSASAVRPLARITLRPENVPLMLPIARA